MPNDLPPWPGGSGPRGAEPGETGGEPQTFWRHAFGTIAALFLGRVRTLYALIPLTFGGILLSGAWDWGTTEWRQRDDAATMTGRGEARVEASWWRIDFNPSPLGGDGTNWRDLARRELCSRFRFVDGSEGGPVSVACRTFVGLEDGASLLHAATPELPVRWVDAAGRPSLDLRLTARAEAWLAASPALWWPLLPQDEETRATHREGSELEALLLEADHPVDLLLLAAEVPEPVAMAFDPARPARAVPLAALALPESGQTALAIVPFLALGGALMWAVGCWIFTWDARTWVRVAVFAGSLLCLPWWSTHLERALGFFWEPAGGLFVFLGPEMVGVPATVLAREAETGDWIAGGDAPDRAHRLSFATSFYADVLGDLAADLPAPAAGTSADEALGAAGAVVTERVLALPDDRLAALVDALYRHGRVDAHGADLLFLDALHRLSLDPERPRLAGWATLALSDMATAPAPSPDQPGYRERRRLWQLLVDHPEPIVYNLARPRAAPAP